MVFRVSATLEGCAMLLGHRKNVEQNLAQAAAHLLVRKESMFSKIDIFLAKRMPFLTGNDGNQKLLRVALKG
jgi:4-diphosphocytidyl-2C-methyl-D-erythritol kinase